MDVAAVFLDAEGQGAPARARLPGTILDLDRARVHRGDGRQCHRFARRDGPDPLGKREVPASRNAIRPLQLPYRGINLTSEGIEAVEIQQGFLQLSHPTKFLLSAYLDQKIRHGNNPVLNWMASCLQLQYDRKDNCQPTKPERGKSGKRIDGIAATVTALARALVSQESFISYTGLSSIRIG